MNPSAHILRFAIAATSECVARLPPGAVDRMATAGGHVEWALRPRKRRLLRVNLAHALARAADDPVVAALAHEVVVTGARRAADVLWAFARPAEALARLRIEPPRGLDELVDTERGVILAGAHAGGFEFALACGLARGHHVAVLTDMNPTALALARWRLAGGAELLPADTPPRTAVARLRAGGVLVVLADLHRPGMRGRNVHFLDGEAMLPAGPAALARLTGAPIVPFAVLPIARRAYRLALAAPLLAPARHDRPGERQLAQALADALSATLRAHPRQWDAVDPIPWRPVAPG